MAYVTVLMSMDMCGCSVCIDTNVGAMFPMVVSGVGPFLDQDGCDNCDTKKRRPLTCTSYDNV